MSKNMALLGKSLDKNILITKTFSDNTDHDRTTRAGTEPNILPTIPHREYGEKVENLLNNYQVKSKELSRISDLLDDGYNTKMQKRKDIEENRKIALEEKNKKLSASLEIKKKMGFNLDKKSLLENPSFKKLT